MGSWLTKSSQSNFNLRSSDSKLVFSHLITTTSSELEILQDNETFQLWFGFNYSELELLQPNVTYSPIEKPQHSALWWSE